MRRRGDVEQLADGQRAVGSAGGVEYRVRQIPEPGRIALPRGAVVEQEKRLDLPVDAEHLEQSPFFPAIEQRPETSLKTARARRDLVKGTEIDAGDPELRPAEPDGDLIAIDLQKDHPLDAILHRELFDIAILPEFALQAAVFIGAKLFFGYERDASVVCDAIAQNCSLFIEQKEAVLSVPEPGQDRIHKRDVVAVIIHVQVANQRLHVVAKI